MKGKLKNNKGCLFSAALGSFVYFLFISDRINAAAMGFATNARNDLLCCSRSFFLFLYIRTS